ncbi:MAG TPA: glycosyltransferase [Myxococcota bacterium]|nr:glycosyltransferase [Myxococcota bacterium]HRY94065.1 glycosyltransferase [Myxococcota bacterium]HSA21356.1 glycosyltransferase [Myxococcota bacterium]
MKPLRILALFGDGGQQIGRESRAASHEVRFAAGCLDDLLTRGPGVTGVRREILEQALADIEGADAVFSDSAEMVLLRYVRSRRGLPPKPWLVNEVDGLTQAQEVRAFVLRHYGEDPLPEALTAPEVTWFTIVPGRADFYRSVGLCPERLFHLPMARASIEFFFPDLVASQDRHLAALGSRQREGPVEGILALGSHARDWATLAEALSEAGLRAEVICNLAQLGEHPAGPILWRGSLPAPDYLQAIARAAVVVLPLREEGRAAGQMSCALPMRMGKAIVASRLPALDQHIEDGVTGLSVTPGDPAALAAALGRLLADRALAGRLGQEARRREAELSRAAAATLERILARLRAQNSV